MNLSKSILFAAVCFSISTTSFGQIELESNDDLSTKYADLVKVEDLKNHLTTIASDDFEGRETGTEGQRKAAHILTPLAVAPNHRT